MLDLTTAKFLVSSTGSTVLLVFCCGTPLVSSAVCFDHVKNVAAHLRNPLVFSCFRRRKVTKTVQINDHQGLGVFATQGIDAHELVAEYVGERVKLAEAEKRVARYREAKLQVSQSRCQSETREAEWTDGLWLITPKKKPVAFHTTFSGG